MGGADAGRPRHAAPGRRFDSHAEFYQGSAYAAFPQQHRVGGSLGLTLMEAHQEPIDLVDAAVPDWVFIHERTRSREVAIDLGDGARLNRRNPANTLTVVPPHTEARFQVSDPHVILAAAIPDARLRPLLDEAGLKATAFGPLHGMMRPAPAAARVMDALWRTTEGPGPAASLLLDGLGLQLLALLAGEGGAALSPVGGARPEDARIRRAVDHIDAQLGEPLSLDAIAAVAALSPSHLARAFKASTGEAVWAYVQRRRCERAREMLETTRLPVTEIALACGFANPGHLATSLRRRWGATPSALRRDAAG